MEHIPVLADEIMEFFKETPRSVEKYLDGTFGRGGHARLVMQNFPEVKVTAIDQDLQAIAYAEKEFASELSSGQLKMVHKSFFGFSSDEKFDIILLDLGVSSPQLDQADRGFSFYHDGPLDMRMNQQQETTAADLIHECSEDELFEIFRDLGEVRRPARVVRAICEDRKEKRFETTKDLAGLIERVEGWSKKGHHPATRYFMALRLHVNRELDGLEESLPNVMNMLNDQGRLAVITFHSLEDRIVKNIFRSRDDLGKPVNKKVVQPVWNEKKSNSRARSAKLRVFQRGVS